MEIIRRLTVVFFIVVSILCVLVTYRWIDIQSTAVLIIFNALFVSLIFQLNGSLYKKLGLLTAGNALGMVWNYSFHLFMLYAADWFPASALSTVYTIVYPFLNSIWVISFWSLSLTTLSLAKNPSGEFLA